MVSNFHREVWEKRESVYLAKPGETVAVDPGRGLGPTYMSNQVVST